MKSTLIILALAATVLANPQPVRPIRPGETRTCVHTRFLREHVCFHCTTVAHAEAFALGPNKILISVISSACVHIYHVK